MGENVGQIWPFRTGTTTTLPPYGSIKGRSRTFNIRKGVSLAHIRVEYRIDKTVLQRRGSTVRKYGYEALKPSKRRGDH